MKTSQELKVIFDRPRFKLIRAKEHIAELKSRLARYEARANCRAVLQPAGDMWTWTVHTEAPEPPELPLLFGDAVHNLRACLDWLACSAVEANGRSPNSVHFPFANDADHLDEQIKKKLFHRAAPEIVAMLKNLKPYKGGAIYLRALHDMDNKDKHSMLLATVGGAFPPSVEIPGPSMSIRVGLPLIDGHTSNRFSAAPRPEMIGVPTPLIPKLYLAEPPFVLEDAIAVAESLRHMTERIVEEMTELATAVALRP